MQIDPQMKNGERNGGQRFAQIKHKQGRFMRTFHPQRPFHLRCHSNDIIKTDRYQEGGNGAFCTPGDGSKMKGKKTKKREDD